MRGSDALGVYKDTPVARLVEFTEEDSLPLAEKHLAVNDGHGDRGLPDQHLPAVRMPVDELVLLEILRPHGMIVVLVVSVFRNDGGDHATKVVEKTRLGFIDYHCGGGVRAVDRYLAMLDARTGNDFTRQLGYVPELERLG